MTGFGDIHSHFVYGVDDGADTREAMERMLDAAHADGIVSLCATSHRTPGIYPFDEAAYRKHLEEGRAYCQRQGYGMQLYSGAEILYTPALRDLIVDSPLPGLAGTKQVLLEFVPDIKAREAEEAVALLSRYGYQPILAHIERYGCFYTGKLVERLKARYGARYQVNAHTVLRGRGLLRTRRIQSWFEKEWVDYVASDAHDTQTRPFLMQRAYEELRRRYGEGYANRLTGLV